MCVRLFCTASAVVVSYEQRLATPVEREQAKGNPSAHSTTPGNRRLQSCGTGSGPPAPALQSGYALSFSVSFCLAVSGYAVSRVVVADRKAVR